MYEEQFDQLLEDWKKAFGHYDDYFTTAEKEVVRWEWTENERYSVLPFHFQRCPGRGRVLKEGPTTIGLFYQYGFDAEGRVRICREYNSDTFLGTTIYRYSDELIACIEFSIPPQTPVLIQKIFLENGRVVFSELFELNGYTPRWMKELTLDNLGSWLKYNSRFKRAEAYIYNEDRLAMISGYYEIPGLPPYCANESFLYDDAGKLLRIDRLDEHGRKSVVYQRRQKGQTFTQMRAEATLKLVDAIVQKVKEAHIEDTVYGVELYYRECGPYFPPVIVVMPERYRSALLQSADPGAKISIFVPIPEKEWIYEIDDGETLETCQILEQEIQAKERWNVARQILRDVAARLTRFDWNGSLNLTPDFVAYALDPELEGDHIADVLRASASTEQIQEWRKKGWLGRSSSPGEKSGYSGRIF